MDEISKALGPFPILQMLFGIVVLVLGGISVWRGIAGKEQSPKQLEDKRAQWDAYRQLENIEQNHQKLIGLIERNNELTVQLIEAVNRWGAFFFNRTQ